jgi:hypothetical protein
MGCRLALLSSPPFSGDIVSQMEQKALVLDRTLLNSHTHHSNVPSRKRLGKPNSTLHLAVEVYASSSSIMK